uniref:Uncharacterized protein n=1 Tax=Solanum lycopersicum TaxID=4081 RepID=A0A3Q7EMG4_SOLLC
MGPLDPPDPVRCNYSTFDFTSKLVRAHDRIAFSVGPPQISGGPEEYAKVSVTANGKPSGIATTMMVTAAAIIRIKEFIISSAL